MSPKAVLFFCLIISIASCIGALKLQFSRNRCCIFRRVSSKLYSDPSDSSPDRPPILPFDFAREDIPIKSPPSEKSKKPDDAKVENKEKPTGKTSSWVEDPSRPTGYGTPDEDDDWVPTRIADDGPVMDFMRNYILDSEYDSGKRKDAKLVVRNIFLISFAIGTIFTGVFYAFPGKFISYKGNTDFSARYSPTFVEPNGLMKDEFSSSADAQYFDDAVGLPPKVETRFAIPSSSAPFAKAPAPKEDL